MNRKSLKVKIKTLKSSLTKIGKFIEKGDPAEFTITILETKLNQLEPILQKFEEAYFQLVDLEDQQTDGAAALQATPTGIQPDEEGEDYVDFEEKYYLIRGMITEKLKMMKGDEDESVQSSPPPNVVNCNHGHDNDYGVKTPYINIGKFDGNSENWLKFYENYRVVIHENPKGGSDLRKFHYLISLLEGEAANLIDDIEVTEDNYEFAWKKLVEFYKNDKKLTETHLGNLFECKKLESQSAKGLRELHNSFVKNINSLRKLGIENLEDNVFVTYLLASKLDNKTLRAWEEYTASSRTISRYGTLEDFIVQQYNYLEAYEKKCSESKKPNIGGKNVKRGTTTLAASQEKSKTCQICNANWHPVYRCSTFLNSSIEGRRELVKKISCCWQCLGFNHQVKECSGRKCSKCTGPHNYLLCTSQGNTNGKNTTAGRGVEGNTEKTLGKGGTGPTSHSTNVATFQPSGNNSCNNCHPISNPNVNNNDANTGLTKSPNSTTCVVASKNLSAVIFPTCLVKIMDVNRQPVFGRFLLDSASELNFITKEFWERLSLDISRDEINVYGIGNAKTKSNGFISAVLKSSVTDYSTKAKFYVMPEITHGCLVGKTIPKNTWNIPNHIKLELADPSFHDSHRKIDGILGVGIFFDIIRQTDFHPKSKATEHYLHKTALGWVICGEVSIRIPDNYFNICNNRACYFTTANIGTSVETQSLNRISKSQRRILENQQCEKNFLETTRINSDGRFTVSLPFRRKPESLGNSYEGARKRFLNLEKRLSSNSELKTRYTEFLREYINLGHMELVNENDIHKWPNYYLPHHPTFKESTTTSLRVVFDGSFKTSSGLSLNDILMTGAALQNDVFDILTAFRFPKFGLTGDVAKMYRQIWVTDSDKDFQRILWRENPDEPLRHYQLKTVTYGTRPAPFLAIRCLHAMADEIQSDEPRIAEAIKSKFFMDDYLDGADSLGELRYKQNRMEKLFKDKGMELRKWCSNSTELMNDLKTDIDEHYCINLSDGDTIKTLGLIWDPKTDDLIIKVHDRKFKKISKRTILSDLHSFWDPMGILSPALVRGRMFLQELWRHSVAWDDDLPQEISDKWVSFRKQLHDMHNLRIPRRISMDNFVGMELHGFSDASEKAYGACIFIRTWNLDGNFSSHLLCSDTHVAPMGQQTLPRLELLAAITLVDLMSRVVGNMKFGDGIPFHYWTDSEIVLTWINGYPQQWNTYVANRVAHIRELSKPIQWHYVCSAENPADITSRGLPAAEFINKNLWWFGPSWLTDNNHDWPIWNGSNNIEPIEQRKITYSLVCVAEETVELINRFSSWKKLVHVIAWIFRFRVNVVQPAENRKKGYLNGFELLDAKNFIIRTVQAISFPDEISRLTHHHQLGKNSKLLQLNGYMDECGLLRVGGRIGNAHIPDDRKFPIILPYKSHLTEIILRHYHENNYHLGPLALLNLVRAEFWPLNGKSAVKSVVHSCVICRKAAPRPVVPKMAPLPAERVTPARPFEVCGVDFCGPINIKYGMRKSVKQKAYIAVFVCFTTKAIHLELVTDMSSQAFLAALKRFFSRRGTSRTIFSDNGTNFVGAQKELAVFVKDPKIKSDCADRGIEWKFIPPGTPHFGGLWEASVKLVKYHLKRTMDKMIMTFEEAYTLLTGIEACLNSRPLTPLSDDPSDPTPLTPAHFLVGGPLNLPIEPDLTQVSLTRRWDRVKQHIQQFWQRWSEEYLSSLQQRTKWKFQHDGIPIGTLVAVKEENLKPTEWKMARVTTLHPGKDGINRVATIVYKDGHTTRRPLVKLCPILTCPNNDDTTDGQANH